MSARHSLATVTLLVLVGCSLFSSGGGTPAPVGITLRAANRLNPDEGGRSLPTVVRVYQLKAASKIEVADYDALYRRDKAVLGEDLVQVDEMVLAPGQDQSRSLARDRATRFVAVVAMVRRPSGYSWRSIVELPSSDHSIDLEYAVEDYRIERR